MISLKFVHPRSVPKWAFLLVVVIVCRVTGKKNLPPVCNQTYVSRSIVEGAPIGTNILNFKTICSDPEKGPLSYTLNDNAITQFTIPASTELLKTKSPVDAEAVLIHATKYFASPWTLRVTVKDNMNATCILTVVIKIVSINDNKATMINLVVPDLRENTLKGTIVGGCTLVDGDFPGSGHDIPYVEIIAGNEDKKFAVDFKSCDITLVGSLDYETHRSYTLTFRAYNFHNDPNATTKKITIKIIDVNDNRPMCDVYNIIRDITEDTMANDILIKINCSDADSRDNGKIRFLSDPQGTSKMLKVNETSGEISLTRDLDFDKDLANRHINMVVIVVDKGKPALSTKVTVHFRVIDIDDQPPLFTQSVYHANLSEHTDIGQLVVALEATDLDSPHTPLSKVSYGFETACTQNWFLIDNNTGAIFVSNYLHWEVQSLVSCRVYAYSSEKYANRSLVDVFITINDVNDNAPVFSKIIYEGTVVENSLAFTDILTLNATDPDEGISGQFTYSFPYDSPFAVNADTGLVYISATGVVDYEVRTDYVLLVVAKDKGTPSMSSQTYISISVKPVNEFTPYINNLNDIYISELAKPGTRIATITSYDFDAGEDGTIKYYLQDPSVPFFLGMETGVLCIGTGLDFEKSQSYSVVIIATDDSRTIIKSSTTTFNIYIDNENENEPECDTVQPITVLPNDNKNPLCQLNCTDYDSNTVLRFDILRGDTGIFSVNPNTGIVQFATTQVEGSFILVIAVSDQGTPAKIAEISVQINVETNLTFANLPAAITVPENTSDESLVFTVLVRGVHHHLTYETISGNVGDKFSLHWTTGTLKLIRKLDRETKDLYNLTIRATNINGQYVEEILTISVQDSNDNCPQYCCSLEYIRISESQPVPYLIISYQATDLDIQQNAEIDYSIITGDPGNTFGYDTTGQLWLLNTLDYETQSFYILVLLASDRGNPSLNTTMIVDVEVLDVNDNSLVIESSGGRIPLTLSENTPIGSAVMKIVVQNNDTNSCVTFTITSGNDGNNFTIDQTSGVVYLIYSLDRETADFMNIGIQASNTNGDMDDTILAIIITDDNDNDPVLNPSNRVFLVPHGTLPGSSIDTLNVNDPDVGMNSEVTLSIISGDPRGEFTFKGKTLLAAALLDANVQNTYELLVLVTDNGAPSRNSTANIMICIDQELKVPLFVPKIHTISVEETCAPGSSLYDADATSDGAMEQTSINSGDLLYSLSSGDSSIFYIHRYSGQLQLVDKLSYLTKISHNLTITASNKNDLLLNDNFTLMITVTQTNMHAPVFSLDIYTWNVGENTEREKDVGRIAATDNDSGEYGVVRFDVEPNAYFKVNSITGVFSLVTPLDYSTAQSYSLRARATDNAGVNSRTAFCLVIINVIDVNNWYPRFTNGPYEINVPENSPVGTVVLVLYAEDLDSGINGTVLYSILSGNPGGMFKLDSSAGALSISSNLDFETAQQHILIVEAKDGGSPPLSNTTIVTINIKDHNDNSAHFRTSKIYISIRRDTPPMTSICEVLALDNDSGLNGALKYVIQNGNTDHLFSIDTVKGIVRTARSLAVARSYYTLIILGIDHGHPQLTGTLTISITITPVANPVAGDHEFAVRENERVDTLVGIIPKDLTLNDIKDYTLTSGNYENAFSISINGNKEGVLLMNKVLDREVCEYYQLTVSVEYSSGVKDIYITVKVLDVNDNFPVFDKWKLQIQVVENLPKGNIVGALIVKDADETGANSEVHLSISPPDSVGKTFFTIEPSGIIKVAEPVSYEQHPFVKFYVVARDSGVPEQSSTATVFVNVVDVIEVLEYKQMDTAFYKSCEFPDDTTEGEEVCLLTAANFELTPGPGDTFTFITVGAESVFHVHPRNGSLIIKRPTFVFGRTRYFQWVIGTLMSAGVMTSRALMVRLDTFNKAKHLVSAMVDTDLETHRSNVEILRLKLQSIFQPTLSVRIWRTQSVSPSNRRRLLSSTKSEALFVVIADDAADLMPNVMMAKEFLTNVEVVKPLQTLPDGTPVQSLTTSSPSVISVLPYSSPDNSSHFLDPAFISLIIMGCITGIALIIGAIAARMYCIFHKRFEKGEDVKELVSQDNNNLRKASFETIGNSYLENNNTSLDSTISNTSNRSSITNTEGATSLTVDDGKSLSRSQSLTGRDASSRKRKITPVNEPSLDPLGSLEIQSDQQINNSSVILDDLRSECTFRTTSIIVSTLDASQRSAETLPSKNSSTMLSSVEDDTFAASEDTSVA